MCNVFYGHSSTIRNWSQFVQQIKELNNKIESDGINQIKGNKIVWICCFKWKRNSKSPVKTTFFILFLVKTRHWAQFPSLLNKQSDGRSVYFCIKIFQPFTVEKESSWFDDTFSRAILLNSKSLDKLF